MQEAGSSGTGFLSAPSRSRTYDLMIKSHLLYQLSYRGIGRCKMIIGDASTDKQPLERIRDLRDQVS